jgi:hypothetical protein
LPTVACASTQQERTKFGGKVLRLAKCGKHGVVFDEQLLFGLFNDEIEDEKHKDCVLKARA